MKILRAAEDVTPEIEANVLDCLDWFWDEPGLKTEEFIDRLASTYGGEDWDIDNYASDATKRIMKIARAARREALS